MRYQNIIPALFAVVAAACNTVSPEISDEKGAPVKFASAKHTALPTGSAIGLYIGEPVNCSNEVLTVNSDGSLAPSEDLFWAPDQTAPSKVLAYYPYNSTFPSSITSTAQFSALEDQSTPEAFAASDLMVCATEGTPSKPIDITLEHKYAQIRLYFDNQAGSAITKVEVEGVCIGVDLDLATGVVTKNGSASKVKACPTSGSYSLLVAPQKTIPSIKVTLANATEFSFTPKQEQKFESGMTYSTDESPIVISASPVSGSISLNFSIVDWKDGGQLDFNGGDLEQQNHDSIKSICEKATTAETSVSFNLKDAVVTKVCGPYVHVQDESGAIIFYICDGLSEGNVINGAVAGSLVLYQGYAEIKNADVSNAAVTSTTEIPYADLTLAGLLADYDKYISARVLLKGVTVDIGISTSSRTGQISQSGSSITIYGTYTQSPATITTGLTGDLICFPCLYKGNKQLSVYYDSDFSQKEEQYEENAFTSLEAYGVYSAADTDSPAAVYAVDELNDQLSCLKESSAITSSFANALTDKYLILKAQTGSFSVGGTYRASVTDCGAQSSASLLCVRKSDSKVWLTEKATGKGYIMAY